MSDTVQQIKGRLSIVDVVGTYVKLTRAGKYWKGLSPFTKEKTPSFFVTPDKGLYHCFSTGKGGDMFTFVQEMEGVDFKGALTILAEKAGVEVVREAPGAKDEREQVYGALLAAEEFFQRTLASRDDVRSYLEKRMIDEPLMREWHIGYAPKEWHALRDALMQKGYTEKTIEAAGLIKKSEQDEKGSPRHYDRFRGRIMFPLRDVTGRTIAFSGRIFEDDPEHPGAKYINSPEGPVFDKSRALYGIHVAKSGIRDLGAAMLVEGQVDLLMAHKQGYRNAVATSGTAFTEHHADLLKRYSPNLLIAYDGDKAGIAAAGRAAAIAIPKGMNVKVVRLPAGVDPADLIKENAPAFKEAVKHAVHIVDFYLAHIAETVSDPRAQKLEVGRTVLPFVALIPNKIDQAHFVTRVAEALSVPASAVQTELGKIATGVRGSEDGIPGAFLSPIVYRDQFLLGMYLTWKEESNETLAERVRKVLVAEFGEGGVSALETASLDEQEQSKILASENFFVLYPTPAEQESVIQEIEAESTKRIERSERERLQIAIKRAAEKGDREEEQRLMEELSRLARKGSA